MKRKHAVLVANDVGGVGGMEKHLEELIQRLKQDYPVTVVASSFRVKDPSGVRFIKVPAVRKPFPLMIAMFSVFVSIRLWFMRDCIIHTTGAIVFNRVDVSTIHFCHSGYVRAVGHDSGNKHSWIHKLNAAISMRIKLLTERFCYRPDRTNRLIAVSRRIRDELVASYPYTSAEIDVIPNGVDIERFHPTTVEEIKRLRQSKGLPEDGYYLLFMGGDWERKGLRWVLHAFNLLAEDYQDLHVVVVGSGDVDAYARMVAPLHRDRVHFAGRHADPENWYGLAELFVFPSQYEACSLSVLEAAASGLALILTDVGGAGDIVEHGVTGYLVEPYGAEIARTIRELLEDPKKIQMLGEAARARVESMTWDDTYRKFKQIYDNLSFAPDEIEPDARFEPKFQVDQGSRQPKILAVATQGVNSGDAERLRTLLSRLPYEMFSFEREDKAKTFMALVKKIFRERPDLVVMEGTGLAGGAAAIIGWLVSQTPYVVSSGDAVGPYVRKFQPILGLAFSLYERILCQCCAGFIGWTPYLVGRALTFGAPKGMTAAGWAPFERTDQELREARLRIREELGIAENCIVVGVAGSLSWNKRVGYCYGYELVKSVLATDRTDIHVLIVGDGDGRAELERLAGTALGRRIHLTGRVPRNQVPDYLAAMDVASLPQSIDQVGNFRYTTKISEYLAVQLPIVTGHLPLAYDFPKECFWRLPGEAPWHTDYIQALAKWLERLSLIELKRKREQVPRSHIAFDRDRQIESVTEFVKDLLLNNPRTVPIEVTNIPVGLGGEIVG